MLTIKLFILFACLCCTNCQHLSEHGYIMEQFQKSANLLNLPSIETKWIEQPLDHFNKTMNSKNKKFNMTYFQNMQKWIAGGPVYIYIGGEGQLYNFTLITGLVHELAEETNGALFAIEHRYYGKSVPFEEVTNANIHYLSSKQALADIAYFIEKQVKNNETLRDSKVVVVGGSYAGNLAAWMRLHYPHLVDAAISSSAPVLAKLDFPEFYETLGDVFKKNAKPKCFAKIIKKFRNANNALRTKIGKKILINNYHICKTSNMTKKINQEVFFKAIISLFSSVVRYDPTLIGHVCDYSDNILNFTNMVSKRNEDHCTDYEFNNKVSSITGWYKMWVYQTCTEFGYYMTAPRNRPFSAIILGTEYYIKICRTLFGPEFTKKAIEKGIQATNKRNGGLKLNVTNVIFVHGELDPWRRLGVTKDLSETAPVRIIPGASHCKDLYANDERTTEHVKKAKEEEKKFIKQWIGFKQS